MENDYNIYEMINESYLTTFGYDATSENTMFQFFESFGRKHQDKMVYLLSDTWYKPLIGETFYITKVEEIYEIIPKLKNKVIVIDNICMLKSEKVDSSNLMIRSKMNRQITRNLREYAMNHECRIILGTSVYSALNNGTPKLMGGDSMLFASDNVFITYKGILDCQKSRHTDPSKISGIDIKRLYLREENLKRLLDD
jgi:hypothetical protein